MIGSTGCSKCSANQNCAKRAWQPDFLNNLNSHGVAGTRQCLGPFRLRAWRLSPARLAVMAKQTALPITTPQDVFDLAPEILRHRLLLTYDALARDITTDHVVQRILATVPATWVSPYIDRRRKVGWDLYRLLSITKDDKPAMRLQQARWRLLNSSHSLAQIADEVGLGDASHLGKCVRRRFGCTALQLRSGAAAG